jgi:hypothetical protein
MFQCKMHQLTDMIIIQPVVEYRSFSPVGDQVQLAQHSELMADSRLGDTKKSRQITNAHFALIKSPDYPQPGSVPQGLIELRQACILIVGQRRFMCRGNPVFMDQAAAAPVILIFRNFHFPSLLLLYEHMFIYITTEHKEAIFILSQKEVGDKKGVGRAQPVEKSDVLQMGIRKSSSKPLKRKYPPGERRKKENYDFLP